MRITAFTLLFQLPAFSPFSLSSRASSRLQSSAMGKLETLVVDSHHGVPLANLLPPLLDGNRRIFLIRHGETDWNAEGKLQGGGFDIELNKNGTRQALQAAEELAPTSMGAPSLGIVASSQLLRARYTADAIAAKHPSAQRVILAGLGEMRFGDFEGLALRGPECTKERMDRFLQINNAMKQDPNVRWPGKDGESLAEVEERSVSALNEILAMNEAANNQYIGVVAHGRTINIMLASLLEKDCRLFSKFRQRNCSINVLDVSPSMEYKSLILNYNDHIER